MATVHKDAKWKWTQVFELHFTLSLSLISFLNDANYTFEGYCEI